MKCIVCKGADIERKKVDEDIRVGGDIVLVSVEVLVCNSCGERYYDRSTMKKIEEYRANLKNTNLNMVEVGKVFRAHAA
jgi:YgiT-type zinc finger domain-containing protein